MGEKREGRSEGEVGREEREGEEGGEKEKEEEGGGSQRGGMDTKESYHRNIIAVMGSHFLDLP